MFQSIIWDFDGTLVDTYPAIARAVNTALAAYGKQADLPRVVELTSISLDHCIVVSPINWSGRHVRILPGGPHEDHPVHGRADHQDP